MSVCPRCGVELANPRKTWSMVGIPDKKRDQSMLTLGFFSCSECEKKFLKIIRKEKYETSINVAVQEIEGIQKGLENMLEDLKKKIERLRTEKSELLEEIEKLKRTGEIKASNLEEEIASLRKEIQSLKKTLGDKE